MPDKLYITDGQAAGFLREADIRRNVLCPLPKAAEAAQPPTMTDGQRAALLAVLRPKCVTTAELLLYNDGLTVLRSACRGERAVLLGRDGERNVLSTVGRRDIAATALAELLEGGAPESAKAHLKLSRDAFLLLAAADTYRRQYLAGLLSHSVEDARLTLEALVETLNAAYAARDTRWLLPFTLMALGFPEIGELRAALAELGGCGVLKPDSLELTGDGERLADELMYLQTAAHLLTLRVRGDALLREELLLLRTKESLWCASLGAEAELFTLTAEELAGLLREIEEERDEPRDDTAAPSPAPAARQGGVAASWRCVCGRVNYHSFCVGCGRPRQAAPPR